MCVFCNTFKNIITPIQKIQSAYNTDCFISVSYTHLDVYKRQELFHATFILVIVNYESIIGKDNLAKYQQ